MKLLLLSLSGAMGMMIALVHGYLGETQVIGPTTTRTDAHRRVLQAIMFLSAVYWFVAGFVLLLSPRYLTGTTQTVVICAMAAILASGSVANFWATRGKHFGWVLLAIACGIALAGAWLP
ncbi:MAG: hypothetical protein AB8B96_02960 [Lysobacterales bacterium]